MIECGRYHNIPREEQICKLCKSNEIENEEHFLISCDAYDNIRQDFLTVLTNNTYQRARHLLIPWSGGAFAPLGPFLCPTTEEKKWPIAPKPGP
jgi:hypothetical protein